MSHRMYEPGTFTMKDEQVFDSWCGRCDGDSSHELARYPVAEATEAERAAAAHGGGAHVHYVARGDRLTIVVPALARAV